MQTSHRHAPGFVPNSLVGADDFRCTIFLNRSLQNLNGMETSSVWLPATVVARPLRCLAISSLCIRRRPATKRGNYTK